MGSPNFPDKAALLTVAEMAQADQLTIDAGTPGLDLMEAAGTGVFDEIRRRFPGASQATVLCGPGNNGGDGFVVARLLKQAGWTVRVGLLGERNGLTGDAATNAGRWDGPIEPLGPAVLDGATVVVDAVFGAGLARPVEGGVRETIEAIGHRPCVAVDMPTGVHGDSGEILGEAPHAMATVTFFRKKPGHLLMPGRGRCGDVIVRDIGIRGDVLDTIEPAQAENRPAVWKHRLPWPGPEDHKYSRGHALVMGSAAMSGAARLAARAAQRAGAGMVTVACPHEAATLYKVVMESILVSPIRDTAGFLDLMDERRVRAVLLGPGAGLTGNVRERALAALGAGRAVVLDADALSVFEETPDLLFEAIKGECLLTPHDGEFRKVFPDIEGDRLSRARQAAARCGASVLLKGYDTVVAAPDGRAVINANAPPDLASAGTGDVLAGIALGLIVQGMSAFDAGAAAAWIHGACAGRVGAGLIAEDLITGLPQVLGGLRAIAAD